MFAKVRRLRYALAQMAEKFRIGNYDYPDPEEGGLDRIGRVFRRAFRRKKAEVEAKAKKKGPSLPSAAASTD